MLTAHGDRRFHIDYSQFRYPLPSPATSTPYTTATHIGIARIGLAVDDLNSCEAIVDAAVSSDAEVTKVHNSEQWDLGDAGTRNVLCLKDPDGIRIELVGMPRHCQKSIIDELPATDPMLA